MTRAVSAVELRTDAPTVGTRLEPELKARVMIAATQQKRSLSNWVLIAIEEKLAREEAGQ
jgi:predicted HicB family RNase H-like nuclease